MTKVSCPLWIEPWRPAPRRPSQAEVWGFQPEASVRLPVRTSSRCWLVEVHVGQGIRTVIFGQTWREGRFLMPPVTVVAIPKASWPRPLWLTTASHPLSSAPAKMPHAAPFWGVVIEKAKIPKQLREHADIRHPPCWEGSTGRGTRSGGAAPGVPS